MNAFETGLVVGKFSPLHLGHELLIRRAMADCAEVIVISYALPDLPGCEPWKREQWLRARFPQARVLVLDAARHALPHNDADALVHREFVGQLCQDVLETTVDAVFTSEEYGDGFAAELARYFTRSTGKHTEVRHVSVDQARKAVPVSGTLVRSDPHAHRALLSPEVYASFVQTVCFLGGESSGKTTMAETMAARLETAWAAEYGRELWVEQGGGLAYRDMVRIAEVQHRREDRQRQLARRYLFCDTSALTTLFYSHAMFGRAEPALERLAERQYNHLFLCAPDFEFVQDGTRREPAFRQRQHSWYLAELARRSIPYVLLEGPLARRIATVLRALK
ncbi:ATPase [Massilia sp. Root418]|uniref:AAA family ATPase n=1 Tax=Massilia sp. Root418 TaxID=1736532 RepID=UPI0006FA6110|nr:AAA family ATPase [Massilia sp. Root418]KQW87398.1 ATPase [Massilia sp. Root418]